jgi:hypothetical protein
MDEANPRHAMFLPGRVLPLFSEARAPLKKAFAAAAARTIPDRAGFFAAPSLRALPFRSNILSALAPATFAAAPVMGSSGTDRLRAVLFCLPGFLFRINIQSAPAPKSEACTGVRCARSSSFAAPCQAKRFAVRRPRRRKARGDNLSSRARTVCVISLSVCRICSRN